MRLLFAEDDALLADALGEQLRSAGFETEHAPNGAVAEFLLLRHDFDVAILDLGLPMVDGLTVLQRVRAVKPSLPVLVLTAWDGMESRVEGLNAGADDYVTKPFDFPELEARLRAVLRRAHATASAAARPGAPAAARAARQPVERIGAFSFDRAARRAAVRGAALELSPREWVLLDLMLQRRDQVVTKERIARAWEVEPGESGPSSLEVYIHRLRRKLDGSGLSIRTVRGLGYLLEEG